MVASLAYLPPPHLIPLENNAFRQLFCHKILNKNTSQRQHPQRKSGVECKVRMENLPERKAPSREIPLLFCCKPTPLTHKQWGVHLALFFGSMSIAQVISESTMGISLKKTYVVIISDLQRSCKDGWKSSHIILHPAFPMLTSDLTTMHLSELRNSHCYDLNSRFYSDFTSVSTYVLFPWSLFSMVGWCGVCGQGRANWPIMGWILWLGYSIPLSYIPLRKDQEGRQASSTTTCNVHRHPASH